MDHLVVIPLPRVPRRSRSLLFGLLAVCVLACVVAGAVVFLLVRHHAQRAAAPSRSQTAPTSRPATPTLSRWRTTVMILNGNGINGAAAAAATVVHHFRYRVRSVGNAPRMDYPQSLVMFRPGLRPEAMRFAHDLGVKLVGPLDGLRIGAIHRAKLVYVLGN